MQAPTRIARAVGRGLVRVARVALILALVVLPLPMAAFIAVFFAPKRQDPSAEIVRGEDERRP